MKRGLFIEVQLLEILEKLEILEILENLQTVGSKGEADHFLEILENLDVLEILEIVKDPFRNDPFLRSRKRFCLHFRELQTSTQKLFALIC